MTCKGDRRGWTDEAPHHLICADSLNMVYKTGRKVDSTTTKVYIHERWLMPLPAELIRNNRCLRHL
ncbi:hypothetical protein [Pyrobaculum sp.]|uniref:hypothetical protein n=1 Tax=Pyrobaculum sp. TaxID=2004705 RepID=UPI003D0AF7A1